MPQKSHLSFLLLLFLSLFTGCSGSGSSSSSSTRRILPILPLIPSSAMPRLLPQLQMQLQPSAGLSRCNTLTCTHLTGKISTTSSDFEGAADVAVSSMNKYGVKTLLAMAPPISTESEGTPAQYECTEMSGVISRYPDRFAFLCGGGTLNLMIQKAVKGQTISTTDFQAQARTLMNTTGFVGFGELAARHDIPVDLHMEAVPEDMSKPEGLNEKNPDTLTANIPSFERMLSHNAKARIVWQHIGWDNTGNMTVELLRKLLKAHDNLYLALRVEDRPVMVGTSKSMPNRIVDTSWKVKSEWLELFKDFPDRFVIGTDEFFGTPGAKSPQSFEETWRILEQLPDELARKIGHDNAERIYKL